MRQFLAGAGESGPNGNRAAQGPYIPLLAFDFAPGEVHACLGVCLDHPTVPLSILLEISIAQPSSDSKNLGEARCVTLIARGE
jgi:hypothetical protein